MGSGNRIVIVQVLCPARHCILGLAHEGESAAEAEATLRTIVEVLVAREAMNPHCGLCGALRCTWAYEAGVTKYASMEEARPDLERLEAEQAATRALMLASGRAYDARRGDN